MHEFQFKLMSNSHTKAETMIFIALALFFKCEAIFNTLTVSKLDVFIRS